jgi:hypothetical protein
MKRGLMLKISEVESQLYSFTVPSQNHTIGYEDNLQKTCKSMVYSIKRI